MAKAPAERARAYRARKKAGIAHQPEPCGTRAAYARHRRNGEQPCQPCVKANSAYLQARRKKP